MALSESEELELLELEEEEAKAGGLQNIVEPPRPKGFGEQVLDIASDAMGQTPIGMAAQAGESVSRGMNRAMESFKLPVPQSIQKGASTLFRGARALGVGAATQMGMASTPGQVTERTRAAFQPNYEPPSALESAGATIGENAPVMAAAAFSPTIGGPLALNAQQASKGFVSPAPLALGVGAAIAKPLFSKGMSYLGDVPEESVKTRMRVGKSIENVPSEAELAAKEVPRIANKFDQTIGELNSEAKKKLSTSSFLEKSATDKGGAFTKDEVLAAVTKSRRELGGVYTREGQSASKTLGNLTRDLQKIRNTVSQNQVHDYIMRLDREIPWTKVWKAPEALTLEDHAMIDVRTSLDKALKARNAEYAKEIGNVSELIETRNQYLKNLALDKIKGQGYQPSNTTVSRLRGATNQDRLSTGRILGKTKEMIGEDLGPKVKAAQVKSDFAPETSRSFNTDRTGLRQTFGRPTAAFLTDTSAKIGVPYSGRILRTTAPMAGSMFPKRRLTDEKAKEFLRQAKEMESDPEKARDLARKLARDDHYTW